mgnify:CR=1 FL=1
MLESKEPPRKKHLTTTTAHEHESHASAHNAPE